MQLLNYLVAGLPRTGLLGSSASQSIEIPSCAKVKNLFGRTGTSPMILEGCDRRSCFSLGGSFFLVLRMTFLNLLWVSQNLGHFTQLQLACQAEKRKTP